MFDVPEDLEKIFVYTGNMLNLTEIKRKIGRGPSEELLDTLRVVLNDGTIESQEGVMTIHSNAGLFPSVQEDHAELSTSVKVFIDIQETLELKEAVKKVKFYLGLEYLDTLILANPGEDFELLMKAWTVMEEMVQTRQVIRLGVSNIETETFIELYNRSNVKPEIIQINLTICCVVPPLLQEFTNQHEIQLLTHNDPQEILLPEENLNQTFKKTFKLQKKVGMLWATRFIAHMQWRGVLTKKGYIVALKVSDHKMGQN